MTERGLPARSPGKTKSAVVLVRAWITVDRTANAASVRGTLCSLPAFIRVPGIVQILAFRSISDHSAPSTSPDRLAHRMQSSSARAAIPSRARSSTMNAGTSVYGSAAWWPLVSRWRLGSRFSRCPRHLAGFSPVLSPFARAASSTRSIRPRSREAVSCFVSQSGLSTSSTWSVWIESSRLSRRGAAYVCSVFVHCCRCFAFLKPGVMSASSWSAKPPNVVGCFAAADEVRLASIGLMPEATSRRASLAFSRASAKLTVTIPPSPNSLSLPSQRKRKAHRFAPLGSTTRYNPPPSEWRPGLVTVAAVRAESLLIALAMQSFAPTSTLTIDADHSELRRTVKAD